MKRANRSGLPAPHLWRGKSIRPQISQRVHPGAGLHRAAGKNGHLVDLGHRLSALVRQQSWFYNLPHAASPPSIAVKAFGKGALLSTFVDLARLGFGEQDRTPRDLYLRTVIEKWQNTVRPLSAEFLHALMGNRPEHISNFALMPFQHLISDPHESYSLKMVGGILLCDLRHVPECGSNAYIDKVFPELIKHRYRAVPKFIFDEIISGMKHKLEQHFGGIESCQKVFVENKDVWLQTLMFRAPAQRLQTIGRISEMTTSNVIRLAMEQGPAIRSVFNAISEQYQVDIGFPLHFDLETIAAIHVGGPEGTQIHFGFSFGHSGLQNEGDEILSRQIVRYAESQASSFDGRN